LFRFAHFYACALLFLKAELLDTLDSQNLKIRGKVRRLNPLARKQRTVVDILRRTATMRAALDRLRDDLLAPMLNPITEELNRVVAYMSTRTLVHLDVLVVPTWILAS
jgi:hypothetical protein